MSNSHQKLTRLITGQWVAQAINVFARLGIADLLQDDAMSAEAIAKQVGACPDSLKRLLRALVTVEIVEQNDLGQYSLTEMGGYLRSDVDGSHRAMAAMNCDPSHWLPWGKALDAVIEGRPVAEKVFGMSMWDYLSANPDQLNRFNQAMTDTSKHVSMTISKSYDFGSFSCLVDIGGGHGTLLKTILEDYKDLKGILFDLPQVLEKLSIEEPFLSRIDSVQGSFLDAAPEGGDIYIMKHIIHDWGDRESLQIFKNIRAVMPDHGRILIAESVLTEESREFVTWLDLNMMVILGGRERTALEFSELLLEAGFRCEGVIDTDSHISLIEGKPI